MVVEQEMTKLTSLEIENSHFLPRSAGSSSSVAAVGGRQAGRQAALLGAQGEGRKGKWQQRQPEPCLPDRRIECPALLMPSARWW